MQPRGSRGELIGARMREGCESRLGYVWDESCCAYLPYCGKMREASLCFQVEATFALHAAKVRLVTNEFNSNTDRALQITT
jgi:hypothetical protein